MFHFTKTTLFAVITMLFVACGGDDEIQPSITMQVNGESWISNVAEAQQFSKHQTLGGVAADGSVLSISVPVNQTGTFALTDDQNQTGSFATPNTDGTFKPHATFGANEAEGTVTIDELVTTGDNPFVKGTFSMTLANPFDAELLEITEGEFTLPYVDEIGQIGGEGDFSAKLDGNNWQSDVVNGFLQSDMIIISSVNNDSDATLGLTVPADITPGTYEPGFPGFSDYILQYNPDSQTFYTAASGEVTITEHDVANKRIKGTFFFDAASFETPDDVAAVITEGAFDVTYQ